LEQAKDIFGGGNNGCKYYCANPQSQFTLFTYLALLLQLAISYLLDCNPRLRLHNKIRQHKTKLIVGTKKFNALAKVNITESRWQCKGPGDEEEV
jgi:hypothetical protein